MGSVAGKASFGEVTTNEIVALGRTFPFSEGPVAVIVTSCGLLTVPFADVVSQLGPEVTQVLFDNQLTDSTKLYPL